MRKFLLVAFALACLFSLALPCRASYTIVQHNDCIGPRPGTQYSVTCAFPSPNTAGNAIFVIGIGSGIAYPAGAVSDTTGNSYLLAYESYASLFANPLIHQLYAFNIHGGSNSVTWSINTNDYASVFIMEVFGTDGVNSLDQTNKVGGSTTPQSTGNITTTHASEFIISTAAVTQNPETVATLSSGFTIVAQHYDTVNGSTAAISGFSFKSVTTTGTYSDSWAFAGSNLQGFQTGIASFQIGSPLHPSQRSQVY